MSTENSEILTVNIPRALGDVLRAGAKKRLMSKADLVRQILLDGLERDERATVETGDPLFEQAARIERRAAAEAAAEGLAGDEQHARTA